MVTAVQRNGLIADVRADDGRDVVVWGTPRDNLDGFTSVDRHFTAGVRYEFHPVNNTSPYEDNACTAATTIGRGTISPPAGAPGIASDGRSGGSEGTAWILGGAVLLAVAALLGGWWLSRRRSGLQAHQM